MIRVAWAIVTALLSLVALPVALFVSIFRPHWRTGLESRLGRVTPSASPRLLIHAASVGEVAMADRLIRAALDRAGADGLVVSTTTPTGHAEASRRFPGIRVEYFPADAGWAPGVWLSRLRVDRVVLAETELWPLFMMTCRARRIPVAIVNARISDRSYPRFRIFRFLLSRWLRDLTLVAAQSEIHRDRLVRLGVPTGRAHISGNLKFDVSDAADDGPARAAVRAFRAHRPLIIFASTHAPEEQAALAVVRGWRAEGVAACALVAPRHAERFGEVARLFEASGEDYVRRSNFDAAAANGHRSPSALMLLDTHGELAGVWREGVAAFVGGSLAKVGGHNVLEPARAGLPVVVGPNTRNFRDEVALLSDAGALAVVGDAGELASAIAGILADPDLARRRGDGGRVVVEQNRGAQAATQRLLEEYGFLPATADPDAQGEREAPGA